VSGDLPERGHDDPVVAMAAEVGPPDAGPVVAVGGGTAGDLGGAVGPEVRRVRAPVGVVEHQPAEMTVRVLAGTTVVDLDAALAAAGQQVALPDRPGSTVGGVLAVGRSGTRRLGWGPVRDAVLGLRYVTAEGAVAMAGGPTVKNVSGYDLCRLLVGSLGTLGLLAEVVLRTRPIAPCQGWFRIETADPDGLRARLARPVSLLWDGAMAWVLLEGHEPDVACQVDAAGLEPCEGPPELPPHRWSIPPGEVAALAAQDRGRFVAQVGVGVVHRDVAAPPRSLPPPLEALHQRIKNLLDPTGRLAPGRSVGVRCE
jgi:glycolate oxidase FAD binding subunit